MRPSAARHHLHKSSTAAPDASTSSSIKLYSLPGADSSTKPEVVPHEGNPIAPSVLRPRRWVKLSNR
eukprot:scaffold1651_cov317-Pinguiococcus_pyrenoidosus.AAC.9